MGNDFFVSLFIITNWFGNLPVMEFNPFTYLTPRRLWNAALAYTSYGISYLRKHPSVAGMPMSFSVEPTNYCNLACPECPSGTGKLTRPRGRMEMDVYKKLIDEIAPYTFYLQLFLQGEPFLHKDLPKMTSYANLKKMYTVISTNGSVINENNVERLFSPPPDKLIFSIDGLDEKTYQNYRAGGTFAEAERGLKLAVELKRKSGARKPFIELQFIVMKQNEHQMADVMRYAEDIGVDKAVFKSMQVSSVENALNYLPENEKYRRYLIKDNQLRLKSRMKNRCFALWRTGVVTWDGRAVPCCFDKDANYVLGNIQKDSFRKIWKSPEYKAFRNRLLKGRSDIAMCRNCTEGIDIKMSD